MHTSRKIILAMALVCAVVTGVFDQAQAADRLSAIRSRGEIRVCIWPDYFAISYRNPRTGELEGIDIDMAREFARSLGVAPVFIDSSFAKLIENMTNDSCDVAMHAVGIRPDRAQHMNFAQPHLVSGTIGVTTKDNKAIRSWADIDVKGVVVVVMKGTVMEPVMRETLKAAQLTVVDDFKAREQEVLSGRADIFMTDFPYGRRMVSLTDWARLVEPEQPLAPTPYAYAVPKGDDAWLKAVDTFVAAVKADGRLRESAQRHGLLPIIAR
ncbi:substrate-binding periplasmic protein [Magnetospirillum moscoviense]|uniref:Amino acid ABC transporter substrate-binding protein n=1 Tax=Magnetospirillum moscoviense TaxID=1437059 RepID=A0A178MJS0_9PROT|nr:ABC transporter substrate-binding protein [Magnetospirillum moscoviense]OAN48813.1 amino acid ABC transporter substrate-binding protein [Magnetospirillum moscoviense]